MDDNFFSWLVKYFGRGYDEAAKLALWCYIPLKFSDVKSVEIIEMFSSSQKNSSEVSLFYNKFSQRTDQEATMK